MLQIFIFLFWITCIPIKLIEKQIIMVQILVYINFHL